MRLDFTSVKDKEALRHQQATDHLKLKSWVDKHMMEVDGQYKMLQAELQTDVRQQTIDLQHDRELGKYYLEGVKVAKR